jgi:hypothetical protein
MLSPPRVRPRCVPGLQTVYTVFQNTHTPKQLDNPSHDPRFSGGLESEQSEDNEDNDMSRSTGFEEWHGFRDTTFDGAFPDGELHPILPSNSLPLPVQSSPGKAKTTLQRYYG